MTRVYAGLAIGAVAAFLGAGAWYVYARQAGDVFAQCRNSVVAGGAGAIGGPFTLTNQFGERVTEKEVLTQPSLVYFGYTFCPDVCPVDTVRNAEVVDILDEMGHQVRPVFVTIDPERDTPEVLQNYVENIHPAMVALTGSEDEIDAAAKAYRVFYRAQEKTDDYYLVDHMTFTYLMDPEKGFLEFFRREASADNMAAQVACFLENS